MSNAEGIAIEPPLLAQFARIAAQWFSINSRVVDILSLIH
jgi:hypothetical protein